MARLTQPLPTLSTAWRDTDLDSIRDYAGLPVEFSALNDLITRLNTVADLQAGTVTRCQAWIDEIDTLETDYADQVDAGTAHLGNAKVYEGLRPGLEGLALSDLEKRADVLEYDTETYAKVRIESGTDQLGTATGARFARIGDLKGRVLRALGVQPHMAGGGGLVRS
jgi:hypothetical protein